MRKKGFKFFCFFVQLLLIILTFLLIPLNLVVVNFPAWIVVLCGVLALACMTVYLILFRTKLVTKIVLPLFAVLVTGFSSVLAYCCPYWDSYSFKSVDTVWLNFDEELTFEQAEEDLLAAMRHLEQVHPMFRDGLTQEIKERYDASLASLRQMQTITVNDLRRAVQIILHPMHDAHTTTYNSWPEDRYLMDLLEKRRLGYGVYSINGRTVGEIITAAAPYYCYESEAWINVDLASLASLRFYEYEEPFTYVWENEAGDCVTEHYTAADFVTWEEFEAMSQFYDGDVAEEPPSEEMEEPFVYYEIDVEHSLAVLTLKECNYNDEYRQCVHEMFQEVREKQIQNVAVDVRGNGGGDSRVANELIRYLPVEKYRDMPCDWRWGAFVFAFHDQWVNNKQNKDLLFDGTLYVLTDSGSFSSAMDFAMIVQDNGLGYIVGEPSANEVDGYGDVALFSLPNSGILMQISTKKWYRIDESNPDQYVMPDYPCESREARTLLKSLVR